MTLTINPGSGPVAPALDSTNAPRAEPSLENALANVRALLDDAGVRESAIIYPTKKRDGNGRFVFSVIGYGSETEVSMPGLPLAETRYLGPPERPDQNIWSFPRLYVDGSSWVWCFAVDSVRERLLGDVVENTNSARVQANATIEFFHGSDGDE